MLPNYYTKVATAKEGINMQVPVILKSKLSVPRLSPDTLDRPELNEKLRALIKYPLTVITASAGYGKTTALTQVLPELALPVAWYNPGPEDDSTYTFSTYLAMALDFIFPGLAQWYLENISKEEKFEWKKAFANLMGGMQNLHHGQQGILVIDDWQLVHRETDICSFFDRFLSCKPDSLQVVLISRENVALPVLNRFRAEGRVLEIRDNELLFSRMEIQQLLIQLAPGKLTPTYINNLYTYTEGWIMAIKLVLSSKQRSAFIPHSTFANLFEYLSNEVLAYQTPEIQDFLLKSSLPEFIGYQLCEEVLGISPIIMDRVVQNGLFLSEVRSDLFKYHNLFRDFLYREAQKRLEDFQSLNQKLANFYLARQEQENALGCFIKATNWPEAAEVLAAVARQLVFSGRGSAFRNYLQAIPPSFAGKAPIILALADEERFTCNYQQAFIYYQQAVELFTKPPDKQGLCKAYRGMAEIYLDLADPRQAQTFLHKAYRLLGPPDQAEKAAILLLLAENKVNQGKFGQAERYRRLAYKKQASAAAAPDKNNLEARLLLRTGRLGEAIVVLENQTLLEKNTTLIHSSFRESRMVLSLCYSLTGNSAKAVQLAKEVIATGQQWVLPLIEIVGWLRLGHALLASPDTPRSECHKAYNKVAHLLETTEIIRADAELNMGRCLLYSQEGNWDKALHCGLKGLDIAQQVGDSWFTAILHHTLGIAAANCQHPEQAAPYFRSAYLAFERCGDSFGKTMVHWWFSYLAYLQNDSGSFSLHFTKFLDLCSTYDYLFLQEKPTLLGDSTGRKTEVLLKATCSLEKFWASSTVAAVAEDSSSHTPALKIFTLGNFQILRNGREIPLSSWRRKNSLRLFHLILTKRRSLLNKEEILAALWPNATADFAERNFKSSLYNLSKVLEPDRKPWSNFHFIQRNGSTYYFNLAADFWLDVDQFTSSIEKACKILREMPEQAEDLLRHSLELYKGDYLLGLSMDEWCLEERERLITLYIKAAEALALLYIQKGRCEEAISFANLILEKDKFWERAYQLLIWCYKKLNNPVMAQRTYRLCAERLQSELGINPSKKTERIFAKAYDEYQS